MPGEPVGVAADGRRWRLHDPGGRLGRYLREGEPYELPLLDEIRRLGLRGSALDIGAHVGNHTLYLAIVCGLTVHAWEGDPQRAQAIRDNVELNADRFRVLADRVVVYPYAAGAEPGAGRWAEGRLNSLVPGIGPLDVRRVDDELALDDLTVVKIDVEGTEPDVLAGMYDHLRRCRPIVYTETHRHQDHDAQADLLEPLGYRMVRRFYPANAAMERWDVDYWTRRYARGGTSGEGSRGELAERKAAFASRYTAEGATLDIGCGDGAVAALLDAADYLGIDPAADAVALARHTAPDKHFVAFDPGLPPAPRDVHLSLDVIHHLTDDADYHAHLALLFSARRFVVVCATDQELDDEAPHVRHRRWTPDVPDGWTLDAYRPLGEDRDAWLYAYRREG